uniref:hypothetical protein n=1 Tax=Pseudomonas syringae TaxID=317 RepID=UPI001E47CA28|nr:hypothetical protein [Pseudomonas syringae]QOQ33327.1 hypothetical protein [Pseudomonas syringae pv. actinidiae]
MPKFFTVTNTVCVLVGGFVVASIIYVNTTTFQLSSDAPADSNGDAPVRIETASGNPLLKASKADVARWFPGTCFAEIYMKNPSYKGKLIDGCIDKTSKEIKAETGVTLGADDFRSSDVITHFKSVYGASNPWRT